VIVPTYNNEVTIAGVLESIPAYVPDVIVVNDGCTDSTPVILARYPALDVVVHPKNRGKGAALASGFARAAERGITHAITMDSDGQHLASDLPKFLEALRADPDALVVGVRDLSGDGPPRKSRILRANSNFWTWVETGLWVADTQSGFRAYPLKPINDLELKCRKYDFEIEVLVKAMWAEVPVKEVPISARYNTGSHSHFRALPDFSLVTRLNVRLILQKLLLPPMLLAVMHRKEHREDPFIRRTWRLMKEVVQHECASARVFALSLGLGVFFSILPIWGFQIAGSLVVAHYLRLSKLLTVAGSNVSFPPLIPFVVYFSVVTGRLITTGHVDYTLRVGQLSASHLGSSALEYLVGSLALATAAGLAVTVVAYLAARSFLALRGARA
jgi:glycosyltransferase involved in cell wall biosynthesis